MKSLLLTAALVALAAPAVAGSTENITGCATVAVEGANYTVFVDPTCYKAPEGGGGDNPFIRVGGLAIGSISDDE